MTLRLTIVLLAFSCPIFGQQLNNDTLIIRTAIKEFNNQEITYIDRTGDWRKLENVINKLALDSSSKSSTFVLTESEQVNLLKQVSAFKQFKWPDELLDNSKRISSDSIWTHLMSAKPVSGLAWVFGFSKPMFFRQNTLCLFHYMARCGEDCGHAETILYKKEGDIWKQWIIVSKGAW